jgi:hypothetical protein
MQAMLSSVGVSATVKTDYQEQKMTVPTYREEVTNVTYRRMPYETLGLDGETIFTGTTTIPEYTKAQVPGKPLETTGYVEVASIAMGDDVEPPKFIGTKPPAPSAVTPPTTNSTSKTDPAPAPAEKTKVSKRSDFGERYHTVNK